MVLHPTVAPRDERQSQAQRLSSPSPYTLPPTDHPAVTVRSSPVAKLKLLDHVRESMRTRHYSPRTEKTYVHWIKRFIFFHKKRHPQEMGKAKLDNFSLRLPSKPR